VTDSYEYDAFGAVRSHVGTSANPYRFTGELQDYQVARQPLYLRARYYDRALGRFLSRDPLLGSASMPQSQNRYPYALNNPTLLIDPIGMCVFGLPCPKPIETTIDKAGDFVECAGNIPGCVKSTTEQYLVAPGLGRLGQTELATCVREHGIEGCAFRQGTRAADWGASRLARTIVGEKGYIDINLSIPIWGPLGITLGLQFDVQKGLLAYLGPALTTPGLNITATPPNQSASTGIVCGGQGTLSASAQGGSSLSGEPYWETGAGYPPIGGTLSCIYVIDVLP
jgi:RHS repeat-associated protein